MTGSGAAIARNRTFQPTTWWGLRWWRPRWRSKSQASWCPHRCSCCSSTCRSGTRWGPAGSRPDPRRRRTPEVSETVRGEKENKNKFTTNENKTRKEGSWWCVCGLEMSVRPLNTQPVDRPEWKQAISVRQHSCAKIGADIYWLTLNAARSREDNHTPKTFGVPGDRESQQRFLIFSALAELRLQKNRPTAVGEQCHVTLGVGGVWAGLVIFWLHTHKTLCTLSW